MLLHINGKFTMEKFEMICFHKFSFSTDPHCKSHDQVVFLGGSKKAIRTETHTLKIMTSNFTKNTVIDISEINKSWSNYREYKPLLCIIPNIYEDDNRWESTS
jgi:hypothetical protein